MALPDLLLSCSILRNVEKESPDGSNPLAPGKLSQQLIFWMSKMVQVREARNSPGSGMDIVLAGLLIKENRGAHTVHWGYDHI